MLAHETAGLIAIVLTLTAGSAAAQPDSTWQVEELAFEAADGVTLAGLAYIPEGEGPFAGAVLIQGSGESDRTNLWTRTFAETLARAGVAALLPDKRGSGASGGDWMDASFEVLARDALAGVERLREHSGVEDARIGLVGLSQGGLVAPLAATLGEVAWVVDVSGAAVTLAEQIRHEMENTARRAELSHEGVAAILEIQLLAEGYVETGAWEPYAGALAAAEGKPWAEIAAGFPNAPDHPIWDWIRLTATYDPIPHWESVDVPILVAYGAEDEDDNVPVVESVRRLEAALAEHGDATIRVVPDAGHALWAPDATQEDLRLNADFVELLTGWIHARSNAPTSSATPSASRWTPAVAASADSLVAARMEADRIPGAALVVVENGVAVHAEGYGLTNVARELPVDVDSTLFRIGSVTKALTALALVGLAEREGIDLRAPVERFLPPGLIPQDPIAAPIQLRHLLTHTAGFDQTGLGRRVDDPADRPSLAQFLEARLVRVRPPSEVGVYDTYGMTLAGYLIERIGGLAYAEHMRQRVFEPLGMSRTWVEAPAEKRDDLAVGYGLEDGVLLPQEYEWYVTLPASSIDATAADMGRLLVALLGDGGGLLSAETARRVRSEVQLGYGPELGAFSWGLWDERRGGWRALHHGGVMAGYTSELYLVPEAKLGFFLAFNRDHETGPPPRLREALTEFVHDRVLTDRGTSAPPDSAVPVATERFAGSYGYTVGCFTCGEGEGWGLGWQKVAAPERGVVAIGDRSWLAVDSTGFRASDTGASLRFLTDERGAVRYLVRGPESWARLDERLLDEALGDGWRDRPPAPLVALVRRANEEWSAAADAYASLASREPANGAYAYWEGYSLLSGGDATRAIAAFERARAAGKWPAWSRYYVAASHAAMGHPDLALDLLERALEEGFGDPGLLASERWWDPLRGRPRFQELSARAES